MSRACSPHGRSRRGDRKSGESTTRIGSVVLDVLEFPSITRFISPLNSFRLLWALCCFPDRLKRNVLLWAATTSKGRCERSRGSRSNACRGLSSYFVPDFVSDEGRTSSRISLDSTCEGAEEGGRAVGRRRWGFSGEDGETCVIGLFNSFR